MLSSDPETIQHAGEHAEAAFDPGASIIGHVLDSNEFEIPFSHATIPLPRLEIGGVDISITKHVVMMWLAFGILFVMFRLAGRSRAEIVPRGLRNVLEVFVLFIRDEVGRRAIPDRPDRFLGYLLTTFFFILTCNLLGLVPFMATATGNVSVTLALALIAMIVIQVSGILQFGLIKHTANLVPHGLPIWLVPIIFGIELLSQLIRPFALCIRLFANMMAGHVVILAFISLIFILASLFSPIVGWAASPLAVGFALFVHFLELMVAFLQAFIFTMLTAQFIGMSVHPTH
jgi:F-type H+-transporting ATPase subunit a